MKNLLILGALLGTASLVHADYNYYPNTGSQEYYYEGQNQEQNTDENFANQLQDYFHRTFPNKYNNVHFAFSNGWVTVSGSVDTREDKNILDQKLRHMNCVQGVNNTVTVNNPPPRRY